MKKTITTIIPFFNNATTLPRMLDSIFAGSVVPDEIILVDDGSTDNSKQVVQGYAVNHPQIKYIYKTHSGVSATRNTGLSQASCNLISFLDADDYIEPNMYETMLELFDDSCDCVVCGYYTHKNNEVTAYNGYQKSTLNSSEFINAMFTSDDIRGFLCTRLFKAELLQGRLFNTDISVCEDLLFQFNLFLDHSLSIKYINKSFYHYVQNDNSATASLNLIKDGSYIYKPAFDLMLSMADDAYIPAIITAYNDTLEYSMYTLLKSYRNGCDVLSHIRIIQRLLKEIPYSKKSLHRLAYCYCPVFYSFTLPHEF